MLLAGTTSEQQFKIGRTRPLRVAQHYATKGLVYAFKDPIAGLAVHGPGRSAGVRGRVAHSGSTGADGKLAGFMFQDESTVGAEPQEAARTHSAGPVRKGSGESALGGRVQGRISGIPRPIREGIEGRGEEGL